MPRPRPAARKSPVLTFHNPANGHVEECRHAFWWTLLFGPFYLGHKGAWGWLVMGVLLGVGTVGVSWLILPLFAETILRKQYLRKGWIAGLPAKPVPVKKPDPFA
jgi:hypothetical protein